MVRNQDIVDQQILENVRKIARLPIVLDPSGEDHILPLGSTIMHFWRREVLEDGFFLTEGDTVPTFQAANSSPHHLALRYRIVSGMLVLRSSSRKVPGHKVTVETVQLSASPDLWNEIRKLAELFVRLVTSQQRNIIVPLGSQRNFVSDELNGFVIPEEDSADDRLLLQGRMCNESGDNICRDGDLILFENGLIRQVCLEAPQYCETRNHIREGCIRRLNWGFFPVEINNINDLANAILEVVSALEKSEVSGRLVVSGTGDFEDQEVMTVIAHRNSWSFMPYGWSILDTNASKNSKVLVSPRGRWYRYESGRWVPLDRRNKQCIKRNLRVGTVREFLEGRLCFPALAITKGFPNLLLDVEACIGSLRERINSTDPEQSETFIDIPLITAFKGNEYRIVRILMEGKEISPEEPQFPDPEMFAPGSLERFCAEHRIVIVKRNIKADLGLRSHLVLIIHEDGKVASLLGSFRHVEVLNFVKGIRDGMERNKTLLETIPLGQRALFFIRYLELGRLEYFDNRDSMPITRHNMHEDVDGRTLEKISRLARLLLCTHGLPDQTKRELEILI